jgi:hypothetical protein
MTRLRNFLLLATLAAVAVTPGLGQAAAPGNAATRSSSSVPNLSGWWVHPSIPGFEQTPKEVWLIFASDQQVRRVYMNVPHSKSPKPSGTENPWDITKATRSSSTPSG